MSIDIDAARRSHSRASAIISASPPNKNSLTFESVVCSQLELKRRAQSFSSRRSTLYRRKSIMATKRRQTQYNKTLIDPPNKPRRTTLHSPSQTSLASTALSATTTRTTNTTRNSSSVGIPSEITYNLLKRETKNSLPMIWDPKTAKKLDESRASKWSIDFPKDVPHYGKLVARLTEEYNDSEHLFEFARKTVLVLMRTSVSHLSDCPKQPNIPIYLFVAGIVFTVKLLQNLWHKYRLHQKELLDEETPNRHDGLFIDILMTSFLVVWFFLGHYWLSTLGFPPQFEPPLKQPDNWCNKTVYIVTLVQVAFTYFLFIFFFVIVLTLILFTRHTIIKRTTR
ncbi:unnamed protein product [Didymodactylos carnosus]|uniref:Uncharacterized protein n=1 Tax=Didymodactylos carnosus TaxID=1234261 RepID=A0A813NX65_9BILA|nr:unnamed protein product [Didymodactylos carnosus]CAF0741833.1 unnamed protein product [Didymodactylos carnosus]CAF3508975.1 unnamed protein product [Didymodactylos carnosus]CAF3520234.1 unnamed protein product [Didymodactylos carnosus]